MESSQSRSKGPGRLPYCAAVEQDWYSPDHASSKNVVKPKIVASNGECSYVCITRVRPCIDLTRWSPGKNVLQLRSRTWKVLKIDIRRGVRGNLFRVGEFAPPTPIHACGACPNAGCIGVSESNVSLFDRIIRVGTGIGSPGNRLTGRWIDIRRDCRSWCWCCMTRTE